MTVSPLTRRRTTTGRRQGLLFHQRRNADLDPYLIQEGIPNLHLNLILQGGRMTNKANLDADPQAGMTDLNIASD